MNLICKNHLLHFIRNKSILFGNNRQNLVQPICDAPFGLHNKHQPLVRKIEPKTILIRNNRKYSIDLCMKQFIFTLALFANSICFAQNNNLPANCPDLQQKITQIKQSIKNLQKFKKGLVPGTHGTYYTNISLCGVNGELEIYENGGTNLKFIFNTSPIKENPNEQTPKFITLLCNTIKKVFGSEYEETKDEKVDDFFGTKKIIIYQPYVSVYPNIYLTYPLFAGFCLISFEYLEE